MAALDVLPLDEAKRYLNKSSDTDDDELTGFIAAAVERVERHVGGSIEPPTASQLLAVKVVLGEYWETQRVAAAGPTSIYTAAIAVDDDGPTGSAPLRMRLAEILGDPASDSPRGSFPDPLPWPDPIRWCG